MTRTLEQLRVLVIEDNAQVARAIARVLDPINVAYEADGREGLARLLRGELFDVILCDVMMPGFSGLDVVRGLSQHAPEVLRRLVMLDAGAFSLEAAAFVRSTPLPLVAKPFDGSELKALICSMAGVDG